MTQVSLSVHNSKAVNWVERLVGSVGAFGLRLDADRGATHRPHKLVGRGGSLYLTVAGLTFDPPGRRSHGWLRSP